MIDKLVEKLLDAIKIVLMNGFKMIGHANEHVERKFLSAYFHLRNNYVRNLIVFSFSMYELVVMIWFELTYLFVLFRISLL